MKDKIELWIKGVFGLITLVAIAVAILAVRNVRQSMAASDWVNHTHDVIFEADAIRSSLHAGDAALRNYLLTQDERDQAPYREAYSEMVEHLEVAKALTRSEPREAESFTALEPLLRQRIDLARELVKLRAEQGLDAIKQRLMADVGGEVLRQIQRVLTKLKEEEKTLLQVRDREAFQQAQTTKWSIQVGIGLVFLLLAFIYWLMRDDLAARRQAAALLTQSNELLEQKVRERTAELATANEHLQDENLERQWANEAIEHQLRYSQLIITSIGDPIVVITRNRNLIRMNPAVTHLSGFEENELIGGPVNRLLDWVTDPAASGVQRGDPWNEVFREGRDLVQRPGLLKTRTGQTHAVQFNVYPLRDSNKVVGAVVALRHGRSTQSLDAPALAVGASQQG
jgi:PAS domain S-box-containing protein